MSNDKHTKVRRYHPIEGLESMAGGVVDGDYVQYSDYEALQQSITELERELERERIRLAACGVVALANTVESAKKARAMLPEYESASCDDVARAVDKQMQLEQQRDELVEKIRDMEQDRDCLYEAALLDKHGVRG